MVEDSSEIASFRFSSSYRKSVKNTKLKCRKQYIGGKKNVSLCKISEENSDNSSKITKLENKVNGCNVIIANELSNLENNFTNEDRDKGEFSIEKKSQKASPIDNDKETFLLSRFVPEFVDDNKISIV